MRIVGLLSWYDESPAMLAAAVTSVAPLVDHIVAVDGAYILFPEAQPASPADQANTIRDVALAHNLAVTVHHPNARWLGNEVEKRTFMFRLAEAVTTSDDWYYVMDADEQVTHVHCDHRAILASTSHDTAEVSYWWHRPHKTPGAYPFPTPLREQQGITKFFRAIPGLHCHGNHYWYRTPDERTLWHPGRPAEEPENLRDIRVQHRNQERDLWRQQQAAGYYKRRDDNHIERTVTA